MYTKPLAFVLELLKKGELPPCFVIYEPQPYGQPVKSCIYQNADATNEEAYNRLAKHAEVFFTHNPNATMKVEFMPNASTPQAGRVTHNVTSGEQQNDVNGLGGMGMGNGQNGMGFVMNQMMGVFDQKLQVANERNQHELAMQRKEFEHRIEIQKLKDEKERMERVHRRLAAKEKEINTRAYPWTQIISGAAEKTVIKLAKENPKVAEIFGLGDVAKSTGQPEGGTLGFYVDKSINQTNLSDGEQERLAEVLGDEIGRIIAARKAGGNNGNNNGQDEQPPANDPTPTNDSGQSES